MEEIKKDSVSIALCITVRSDPILPCLWPPGNTSISFKTGFN